MPVTRGSINRQKDKKTNEQGVTDGKRWDRGLFYGTIHILI